MDDEIWKVFTSETLEITDALEESILAYETSGSHDTLNQAYHQIHSIKGSLGIIEFNRLESLVHKTEDLFQLCMNKPFLNVKAFVRTVLFVIDLIRKVINSENEKAVNKISMSQFKELHEQNFYSPSPSEDLQKVKAAKTGKKSSLLRIDSGKLDELLDLTGELLTVGDSFRQLMEEIRDSRLSNRTSLLIGLIDQLSEKTLEMRMIPLSSVMNRFKRTIHDLAEETGKKVNLHISGELTEVDKTIAEKIVDPMTHLIRNCVDHGIDPPGERQARGQNPQGQIYLSARHENDSIIISIKDDGVGLDYDRILARAKSYPDWNGSESEEDLAKLIFEPGFSTAEKVSTISGRGMGMSAVRDSILNLRGSLNIKSRRGEGTEFIMRFPLSLALVEGLLIQMNDCFYIIPLEDVLECLAVNAADIDQSPDVTTLEWNEQLIPLINLKRVMDIEGDAENVVIVKSQSGRCGILCDRIIDILQTVVKPLHPLIKRESWLQGSSVLGSGEPVMILNISGLFDQFRV